MSRRLIDLSDLSEEELEALIDDDEPGEADLEHKFFGDEGDMEYRPPTLPPADAEEEDEEA